MTPGGRRGAARIVVTAAVASGALVGVATASRRRAPQLNDAEGVPGLARNVFAAIIAMYFVFALVIVVVALTGRRAGRPRRAGRTHVVATALAFALMVFLARGLARLAGNDKESAAETIPSEFTDTSAPDASPTAEQSPTWGFAVGLVLALVIAAIVAARHLVNRRNLQASGPAVPLDVRQVMAMSLDELLAQLDAEPDPRRAVLLADHGMELVLARQGMPRQPSETADEFLRRIANVLGLSRHAAATLTALYASAHFGQESLTASDRTTAIDALRSVRDELRRDELRRDELRRDDLRRDELRRDAPDVAQVPDVVESSPRESAPRNSSDAARR